MRYGSTWVSLLLLLCGLYAPCSISISYADEESTGNAGRTQDPDSLIKGIAGLRVDARYDEALIQARELTRLLADDPAAKPWRKIDAEWLLKTLEQITTLSKEDQEELSEADGLVTDIEDYWSGGEYAKGVTAAERQLQIYRRHFGDAHPEIARSLNRLALCLFDLGDHARAEEFYHEALNMSVELLGREHPDVAEVDSNLGWLAYIQTDYRQAEQFHLEALTLRREVFGEEHDRTAMSLSDLAAVYWREGDFAKAEPLLRDAVAKCRKRVGNEHEDTATLLYNLACLLMDQGDYSAAESLYRETLAIRRKQMGEDSPRVASCLKALATLLYRKGDYEAGEPILQEALEMNRRRLGEDHLEIASNRKSLASFRRQKGDYGGAIELLNLAIPSLVRILGEEHPKVAAAYDALGCCLGSQHRYAEAEVDFARALEMFRKLLGEEHPKVAMVLNDMAINDLAQGRYQEAETAFKQAADVFETARLRAGEGLTRARFQESPYTRLAATRLRLGDPMGAWRAAERGLGRALADLLIATGQRTLTPFEIATQDSLNGELGRLERQLEALGKTCETDSTGEKLGEFNEKRTQLLYTEAAWSAFQRGIASRYPVTEGQVFPLERIQRGLDDETAILGWLHTEMEEKTFDSWGYLIRHSGPVTWIEIKGADDVVDPKEPTAFDFHEALIIAASWPFRVTEVERIEADAQAICERWIDPFSECLTDIKNLVIIPTGPMLGIPIEALKDHGGRFIGDRYAVSYAPSATIYTWLQEMGKRNSDRPSHKALLVGDPPFTLDQLAAMENQEKEPVYFSVRDIPVDLPVLRGMLAGNQEALASLPRLPGTREEVKRVASVLPDAMTLIGPDATEQEIVDLASSGALGEFDLLHFATHTLMDDEQPERSALVLSLVNLPDPLETTMEGKRIYDGLVTLEEIVREWDLEADLVVLSGCQTALGGKMAGEGFIGLAYAVLQAGARSVLVSLWRVEDTATSLLMGRFYENLTNSQRHRDISGKNLPMNKAEALGEAKQWLRNMTDAEGVRPFQHPTYWSSFILIGER